MAGPTDCSNHGFLLSSVLSHCSVELALAVSLAGSAGNANMWHCCFLLPAEGSAYERTTLTDDAQLLQRANQAGSLEGAAGERSKSKTGMQCRGQCRVGAAAHLVPMVEKL